MRVDGTAIDSCLYLAVWADGKSIRTVEENGRATSSPTCSRPLSTRGGAVRLCTPGLVMASAALLDKTDRRPLTEAEIRGLSGICAVAPVIRTWSGR